MFESTLQAGTEIQARWTNSFNAYREPATVVRVNASSIRVRILAGYLAGKEISMPRVGAAKYSQNNGCFPAPVTK